MTLGQLIGPKREIIWVLQFWPVLVSSFVFALAGTWLCKKVAIKFRIVDKPDNLVKTHKEPVAYLGGLGMLMGFTVSILVGLLCLRDNEHFAATLRPFLGVLVGAVVACLVGLADDLFNLSPRRKILGQIVAAVFLLVGGIKPGLQIFALFLGVQISPLVETMIGGAIVIIFVLGATNSLNLLDGLDGLCAGVTVVITVAMLILSIHLATWEFSEVGDPVRLVICLGLVGCVCGFLPFNRYPAKIFMGDAGSMLLGFIVVSLMILFGERIPRWWMASIMVFGLPILDTAVALARRLLNRRPLFVSDRGHIYDQMIDRGIPLKKTVAICYVLAGVYAIIGLAMGLTTQIKLFGLTFKIKTWPHAVIVYIVVFAVSALVVWRKGYLKMEGLRGAIQKQKQ